jgi:hypothetical protein
LIPDVGEPRTGKRDAGAIVLIDEAHRSGGVALNGRWLESHHTGGTGFVLRKL